MVARLIILLALLVAGFPAHADLDLTPTAGSYLAEAVMMPNVTFHDGLEEITYVPPRGWVCSRGGGGMAMSIPSHNQANAYIRVAPRLRISSLDEQGAAEFTKKPGLMGLPKGAEQVQIAGVTPNPLVIDGHPTLEVVATYQFYGQNCTRSLLLMERGGTEVSFMLDCLTPDFQELHGLFKRSLYGIENL